MRRLTGMAIVACTLLQGGCHPRLAPAEVPAVLTSPTAATRAELVRVVTEAMNGAPVTIADTALTTDDTLIIERAQRQSTKDMNLGGREAVRPHHFRLAKTGSGCVLVHRESGRRWTLTSATCSPR